MSFEHLIDPATGPQWKGVLPGKPQPYVLRGGEGEHAMLFGNLFTVLLSGDETGNQFGTATADSPAGDVLPTHAHDATHETTGRTPERSVPGPALPLPPRASEAPLPPAR